MTNIFRELPGHGSNPAQLQSGWGGAALQPAPSTAPHAARGAGVCGLSATATVPRAVQRKQSSLTWGFVLVTKTLGLKQPALPKLQSLQISSMRLSPF